MKQCITAIETTYAADHEQEEVMLMTTFFDAAHAQDADRSVSLLAEEQFIREVKWIEPLPLEEEACLFERVARSKREPENQWCASLAKHARDRLVEAYQESVVFPVARKMHRFAHAMQWLDLVNEASIVLLAAIDRYVEQTHYTGAFAPFARIEVVRGISLVLARQDGGVCLPRRVADLLSRKRTAERKLIREHGRLPTLAELAAAMDESRACVQELVEVSRLKAMGSVEAMIEAAEMPSDHLDFVSLYAAQMAKDEVRQADFEQVFEQVLGGLGEHERQVVCSLYGVQASITLSLGEMSQQWAMTYDGLRKARDRALGRLRTFLEPQQVNGVLTCKPSGAFGQGLYNTAEAARILGISVHTLRKWARQGCIPFERRAGYSRQMVFSRILIDAMAATSAAEEQRDGEIVGAAVQWLEVAG